MTALYKVLTHEPSIGERLRPYEGVCATCRGNARRALAGGTENLRAILRGVRGTTEWEHYVNGVIELLFEEERRQLRVIPARFRSIHAFRTLDACRRFRLEWRPNATGIFAVESDGELRHNGFMEWLNATAIDPDRDLAAQLSDVKRNAMRYWRSDAPPGQPRADAYTETLLSPNVRVLAVVERF